MKHIHLENAEEAHKHLLSVYDCFLIFFGWESTLESICGPAVGLT